MGEVFLIRQAELLAMKNNVCRLCAKLQGAAEASVLAIDQFVHNDTMHGTFIISVKAYMSQVHKLILKGFIQSAHLLSEEAARYVNGYAAIDEQQDFILPSDQMEEFCSAVSQSFSSLCVCTEQAREILQRASVYAPAIYTAGIDCGRAGELTQQICIQVRRLEEAVAVHEAASLNRLSQVRALTESLDQTIRLLQCGETPGLRIGLYAAGTFSSLAGASATFLAEQVLYNSLAELGIGEKQIHVLERYGYTPDDLMKLMESCETDYDRQLLQCMFNQDYETAFAVDPVQLSDEAGLVISDYACRLLKAADAQQLQAFVNGMLQQTGGVGWFSEAGTGVKTVRMSYMETLFQGTMVLLELNSSLLMGENVTQEMKERNWNLLSLANLWNVQYHLEEELQYKRDPAYPPMFVISNADWETGELQFTYFYTKDSHNPFQDRREVDSIEVFSDTLETSEDLLNGMYLAEREKLEESADHLLQKVLGESIWSSGCSVLSVVLPEMGLAMKMLQSAVRQDTGKADNHIRNLAGKVWPEGTGTDGIILGEAIDGLQTYLDKNAELSERIRELDRLYEGSMWGSGIRGSYVIPDLFSSGQKTCILSGIYNPDYLETIGNWNRQGIAALIPEADAEEVRRVFSEHPMVESLSPESLEYKMIFGFENQSILDFPIQEIAAAKQNVESIVRDLSFQGAGGDENWNKNWNVEHGFRHFCS